MAHSANCILVADDEAEILSEVTSFLRRQGHVVIPTSSFGEAVRAYTDNADRIGLVLTDVVMPDGNGADLARFVVDRSEGACPCLLMSGNFDTRPSAPDFGMARIQSIAKPFGLSQLYRSVLGALATSGLLLAAVAGCTALPDTKMKAGRGADNTRAMEQVRPLAEQGDAKAQLALGQLYENGQRVKQDNKEALKWYRASAEQGNADAQRHLALMYSNRTGVQTDRAEALKWLHKAADQGDGKAALNLAAMYEEGMGVARDHEKALIWYQRAAQGGDAAAQYNLGAMYESGAAMPKEDREALKWYQLAAQQGLPSAQYNLASMYEHGRIVQQDSVRSLMWYTLAASPVHGDKAKSRSDSLRALTAEMTPAQIEHAHAMALTCEASSYQGCV